VLDEGIDVPETDVGVIVAGSRNRRQMIHRMGRIIRPNRDGRAATFLILYVRDTFEDSDPGAHTTFLDEIVDLADAVHFFPAGVKAPELLAWYLPR
jgi:RNA polymerase primary sigma factor